MKSIITAFIIIPFISIVALAAAPKIKEGDRKPSSIEQELLAARLNLADVLAKGRNSDKVCEISAYQTAIMNQLSEVQHMEGFNPSMITNDIKAALAGTIALKEVMGQVDLNHKSSVKDYEQALINSYFESPGMGAYGPHQWMTFKAGGKVDVTFLNILDEEPWSKETKATGTWGVKISEEKYGRIVRVWFTVNGKTKAVRLQKSYEDEGMWVLKAKETKGKEPYQMIKFYNFRASECEA